MKQILTQKEIKADLEQKIALTIKSKRPVKTLFDCSQTLQRVIKNQEDNQMLQDFFVRKQPVAYEQLKISEIKQQIMQQENWSKG